MLNYYLTKTYLKIKIFYNSYLILKMDNDISNSTIRSNSANVSKIFDNYMQQIMPSSVENKENIFIQERSNHRLKSTI